MRKTVKTLALITSAIFPVAFETKVGWKMDGDKLALDGNGNPIYINAAGEESAIKGDTIANLNQEARNHRTAKEKAEGELAKFRDASGKLIDPAAAMKAIETVSKIDAKTLIDAGKVDEVRDQMRAEFTAQLSEKDKALGEARSTINDMRISDVFKSSEFLANEVAVPRDMFEATFRRNFKIGDDGKIEAFDANGNRLLSKKNVGEPATGDEALRLMVEQHAQKDFIIKANPGGGSGNNGNGGARGGGGKITRAEFEALDPVQQQATAAKIGAQELTMVD